MPNPIPETEKHAEFQSVSFEDDNLDTFQLQPPIPNGISSSNPSYSSSSSSSRPTNASSPLLNLLMTENRFTSDQPLISFYHLLYARSPFFSLNTNSTTINSIKNNNNIDKSIIPSNSCKNKLISLDNSFSSSHSVHFSYLI